MNDHVYRASDPKITENGRLLLTLDLGFGVYHRACFRLFMDGYMPKSDDMWHATGDFLNAADMIFVKSVQYCYGQYEADISFKAEGAWYNLTKLLIENQLLWGKEDNASKQG